MDISLDSFENLSSAQLLKIDLDADNLLAGTVITDQFEGVRISSSSEFGAMLFDTNNTTGGNFDLSAQNLGNVLIISEDGDSRDPDDSAAGGTISFEFEKLAKVTGVGLLDIDERGSTISFFDDDSSLIKTVEIENLGNNSFQELALDVEGVARMDINLAGSGAVTELEFLVPNHQMEHHEEHSATPLLTVADFNGDGQVDITDIRALAFRHNSVTGDDLYHPLYDLNADGKINGDDLVQAIDNYGADVPLLDRQIARATQATMKYYGLKGLEQALADGYLPFTQEVKGHGIHYFNFTLATEVGTLEDLAIERPVGLNYDAEGNLLAVFYIRVPDTQEVTPENPFGDLFVNLTDDFPPSSFDTLTADDWHNHQNFWMAGLGSLNSESVYGFEEFVPIEATISRLQNINFQLFPESDQLFSPKFWMLHGWFHSLNSAGTFANLDPDVGIYAPEELGVHGGHDQGHQGDSDPLIVGTDEGEQLFGTDEDNRINAFGGDDFIFSGLGDDSVWGGSSSDLLKGESGNDMLYGGPGSDFVYGDAGNDRLFGGTEDDIMAGGAGDDLLRGSLGYDVLTGDEGRDIFVLASGEGTDIITDLELDLDTIVLYAGITTENLSIDQIGNDTALGFNNETLAIISGVEASALMAASDDVFLAA